MFTLGCFNSSMGKYPSTSYTHCCPVIYIYVITEVWLTLPCIQVSNDVVAEGTPGSHFFFFFDLFKEMMFLVAVK